MILYYKMRQILLQKVEAILLQMRQKFLTKCLIQAATVLLQIATIFKNRFWCKMQQLLQL